MVRHLVTKTTTNHGFATPRRPNTSRLDPPENPVSSPRQRRRTTSSPHKPPRRTNRFHAIFLVVSCLVTLATVGTTGWLAHRNEPYHAGHHRPMEPHVRARTRARTKTSVSACGDWTPRGDLNDPDHNATHTEPIATTTASPKRSNSSSNQDSNASETPVLLPSCPGTAVGKTISLDNHRLRCRPDLSAFGRAAPVLALDVRWSHDRPEHSVVMPSCNARSILERSVPKLCQTTTGSWEVVLVLDGCYDDSLKALRRMLLSPACQSSTLTRARVVVQPTEVLETSSDNLGFLMVNPSHFIAEVQSDMLLVERGWNRNLARPLLEYGDIFSVSGRCGHGQGPGRNYFVGRCGANVGALSAQLAEDTRDAVVVTATNNRGPILWRADALKQLGYLDEVHFVLGNDDHDLNRRANFYGWKAAYKYAGFYAPLNLSPQRNQTLTRSVPAAVVARKQDYKRLRKAQNRCDDDGGVPRRGFSPHTPNGPERRPLVPVEDTAQHSKLPALPALVSLEGSQHNQTIS